MRGQVPEGRRRGGRIFYRVQFTKQIHQDLRGEIDISCYMPHAARLAPILLLIGSSLANAQYKSVNPRVAKIVSEINDERITATQKKLETFGTRQLLSSQDDSNRGIGAARKWIYEQFR